MSRATLIMMLLIACLVAASSPGSPPAQTDDPEQAAAVARVAEVLGASPTYCEVALAYVQNSTSGRNEDVDYSPPAYERMIRDRAVILSTLVGAAADEDRDRLQLLYRSAMQRITYEESEGWIMDEVDDSDQFWEPGHVEAQGETYNSFIDCWLQPSTDTGLGGNEEPTVVSR